MKACLFVIGAFAAIVALQPVPADARTDYYCLRRAGSIGPGRCDFSTRAQCMRDSQTVHGRQSRRALSPCYDRTEPTDRKDSCELSF